MPAAHSRRMRRVAQLLFAIAHSVKLPYAHCRAMRSARAAGVRIAATAGKGAGAYATAPIAA